MFKNLTLYLSSYILKREIFALPLLVRSKQFQMLFFLLTIPVFITAWFSLHPTYFLISRLAAAFCYLLIAQILVLKLKRWGSQKLLFILFCVPLLLLQGLELISYHHSGSTFNDGFFYHLRLDTIASGIKAYPALSLLPLIYSFLAIFLVAYKFNPSQRLSHRFRKLRTLALYLGLMGVSTLCIDSSFSNFIPSLWNKISAAPTAFDGKKATALGINWRPVDKENIEAKSGKNVIFVYLESVEQVYLNEKLFPGLLPNLQNYIKNSFYLSNIEEFPYTTWTMAGIFSSQCGVPLLSGGLANGNDYLMNDAKEKLVCLGDILKKAGYHQEFMMGSWANFAGQDEFLTSHGYDRVWDFRNLFSKSEDRKYVHGWGLYDDTLYKRVKERLVELEKLNKPFNFSFITIDTHSPSGHVAKSCPKYPGEQEKLLQALHCSDSLFYKFYEWFKGTSLAANTTVFVMSDHLAMRNDLSDKYGDEKRKLIALALGEKAKVIRQRGSHVDIAPTLLDIMGVKTNATFIVGKSLLQENSPKRFNSMSTKFGQEYLLSVLNRISSRKKLCQKEGVRGHKSRTKVSINGELHRMTYVGSEQKPLKRPFVIKLNSAGDILNEGIFDLEDLYSEIENEPDQFYLILGRTDLTLPEQISRHLNTQKSNWFLYLGQPSNMEKTYIKESHLFENLEMNLEACIKVFMPPERR